MLKELIVYRTLGSVRQIEAIALAVARAACNEDDLFIIANGMHEAEIPCVKGSVSLLIELGFCAKKDGKVKGSRKLIKAVKTSNPVKVIAQELFKQMLTEGIISLAAIKYCPKRGCVFLDKRDISTDYCQMRNLLIETEILKRNSEKLIIDSNNETVLQKTMVEALHGLSPKQLLEKLERDRKIGEMAENFVMEYEKKRIGEPLANKIKQVSLYSVSEGYDIASFETAQSTEFDRFIEVKAEGNNGFFLSENERNKAKECGNRYYIYLVDTKILDNSNKQIDYAPDIIRNPFDFFSNTSDWRILPNGYHITRLD